MSDIQLKSEIESLVNTSGYEPSRAMLCSVVKVITMRHRDVSQKRIYAFAKEKLC